MPLKQWREEDTSVLIVSTFKSLVQQQLLGCWLAGGLPEPKGIVLPAQSARLHMLAVKLRAQSKCKGKIPPGKKNKEIKIRGSFCSLHYFSLGLSQA